MKKSIYLGIIALATLSLASCSKDEVVESVPQQSAIEFGTYLGRDAQSRGVLLDDSNLLNFGVFATYTGQSVWANTNQFNFMFNQVVSRTAIGAAWTYSPKKYWPTTVNDQISFWAYAPYKTATNGITVTSTKTSTGVPQITYTLAENNLANVADFTADVLMNETKGGNGTSIDSQDRNVSFNLMHELSRISFQAKLDRDAYDTDDANKTQVNITKIEFGGTKFVTEATYSFATANHIRGSWEITTDGTKTLDITELLATSTTSLGGYAIAGVRVPDTNLVTLFAKTGDKASYLFHIPTNGTVGTAAEGDVTLTVSYDIVTIDDSLDAGYSVTPATKRFKLPAGSLKQGNAYNYILTFGLNEIKLSASVADWEENTVYDDVDWTIEDVL